MLISVLTAVISLFSLSQSAYAHFIVEDTNTGVKALFHITPDHDPIAGKKSIISFDFSKTGYHGGDFSYSLKVKSTKNEAVTVPIDAVSNVVMATYIFPSQGFYDITLTATRKSNGAVSKLQYGQRVSRGVIVEHSKGFGTLEISAMVGAVLVAVGAVIFSLISDNNKRKAKKK